jgi:hypothetical protein
LRIDSANATSSKGSLLIVYADAFEGLGLRIVSEVYGSDFAVSGNNDGALCGNFSWFVMVNGKITVTPVGHWLDDADLP